jgi:hypothetical protein
LLPSSVVPSNSSSKISVPPLGGGLVVVGGVGVVLPVVVVPVVVVPVVVVPVVVDVVVPVVGSPGVRRRHDLLASRASGVVRVSLPRLSARGQRQARGEPDRGNDCEYECLSHG